mgnify:CR=1 FL=1
METQINEVEVNGKTYVLKNSVQKQEFSGNIKIVILQRGWVMIGRLEREGAECKLHNASVIRKWGTSKGLGELALNGPLPDTILDPCNGLVEFDYLTVVATIAVNEDVWENEL